MGRPCVESPAGAPDRALMKLDGITALVVAGGIAVAALAAPDRACAQSGTPAAKAAPQGPAADGLSE